MAAAPAAVAMQTPVSPAASPSYANPGYVSPLNYNSAYESIVYAGFWLRFIASLIDGIIVIIFSVSINLGADALTHTHGTVGAVLLIDFLLNWLYSALMESSHSQATLGKLALGIKVTDMEGNPISFGRSSGRYFGKIISKLILLIGYIMAAFTAKKQALHDMLAGCLVVRHRLT